MREIFKYGSVRGVLSLRILLIRRGSDVYSTEIDVVGISEKFILVGECKYSNKKVGIDILEQLEVKSKKIELNLPIKYYLLFFKSGFTKDLLEIEKNRDDVVLIDSFL